MIIFFGDSITQFGAEPGGYIDLLKKVSKEQINIIGAGIAGNKVPDLQDRLNRDVLSHNPDRVIIFIGVNDVWHWHKIYEEQNIRGTLPEDFESGLQDLIERIQTTGAEPFLATPLAIGEKLNGQNEMDEQLDQYSKISRKVAHKNQITLIDLRKAACTYLLFHNPDNLEQEILTTDGVHLNEEGNRFVATEMYKALF